MNTNTEILQNIRRIVKYYEKLMKSVCEDHHLLQLEVNILAFLHHNPQKDTASDIVELRMLPKGNVSQSVDRLIQRGLLKREIDEADKRRIHLFITEEGKKIIPDIVAGRKQFEEQVFSGFSQEEKRTYQKLMSRIFQNTAAGIEKLKEQG